MTVPNLLFLTHRLPYPPDKGDRIRTYHLLRYLARYANVHLIAVADEPVPPEAKEPLAQLCTRVASIPVGHSRWVGALESLALGGSISEGAYRLPALKKLITDWSKEVEYSAVIASASSLAQYLRLPGLAHATKIVDVVDVDSQKWFDYAAATAPPKSWLYALEGRRLRKTERDLTSWANAAILVSAGETAIFREATGADNVFAATNGVDLDYYQPTPGRAENGCVFVGALDYKPNIDAACWFAKSIWPQVRQQRPEATFRIVGRKPVQAVRDLANIPGIEVPGQVPDVRPYLSGAAVVVAPLRIARGLQNKVLEALAAGKAVVSSPAAIAGFSHREELPVCIANDPREWIARTVQMLGDPVTRQRFGNAGRAYAEKYHDWSACLEPFGRLLGFSQPVAVATTDREVCPT